MPMIREFLGHEELELSPASSGAPGMTTAETTMDFLAAFCRLIDRSPVIVGKGSRPEQSMSGTGSVVRALLLAGCLLSCWRGPQRSTGCPGLSWNACRN